MSLFERSYDSASASSSRTPWWLWLNLLSLDAPLVAVSWQLLFLQTLRLQIGWREPLVLFLAVWTIYLGDRVLDAYCEGHSGWQPERKAFSRRHRASIFLAAVACGGAALRMALCCLSKTTLLCSGCTIGAAVLLYFAVVHVWASGNRCKQWPRELAVAIIFALGTFAPIALRLHVSVESISCAFVFSLLCWVNCCLIETREWCCNKRARRPGLMACLITAKAGFVLQLTIAAAALLSALGDIPVSFAAAVIIAAAALLWVARRGENFSAPLFRVAADAALCSPLLVLLLKPLA